MREIITIQVGQCGNQIGYKFWESIASEHGIDTENGQYQGENEAQIAKSGVYFNEVQLNQGSRFVPRALLIDLEPGVLESIQSSTQLGKFFKPDNYIHGSNGAGNNWAKGYYSEGSDLIESILDQIRKEVENSDCLQGFQLTHSLGGGTGSGLGSNILNKLEQDYSDKMLFNFSVYPGSASESISDVVVEPYNTMFSLKSLIDSSHMGLVIENQSLYRICSQLLKVNNPSYADINYLVAQTMSNATASIRFPGVQNNSDIRKLCTNLIPFPRLHFIMQGSAPLLSRASSAYLKLNEQEITQQMFDSRTLMCESNPQNGKILTGSLLFRGKHVSESEVDKQIKRVTDKCSSQFVEWIPNRLMTSVCSVAPPYKNTSMCGTIMLNSTSISKSLRNVEKNFEKMYRKKAFVHWYTAEGMDIQEFDEAQSNLNDLISEYQQYQEADNHKNEGDEGFEGEEETEVEYIKPSTSHSSRKSDTTRAESRISGHDEQFEEMQ